MTLDEKIRWFAAVKERLFRNGYVDRADWRWQHDRKAFIAMQEARPPRSKYDLAMANGDVEWCNRTVLKTHFIKPYDVAVQSRATHGARTTIYFNNEKSPFLTYFKNGKQTRIVRS